MAEAKTIELAGGAVNYHTGVLEIYTGGQSEFFTLKRFFEDLGVTIEDCMQAFRQNPPPDWFHHHHPLCGVETRSCYRRCPKDLWETTGLWIPLTDEEVKRHGLRRADENR